MKTDLRVLRASGEAGSASAQPQADAAFGLFPAQVLRVGHDETVILCHDREWRAALASQVPGVITGQSVLVALPAGDSDSTGTEGSAPLPALIVAAWPAPGAPACPPWQFDRETGSLALEVAQIDLAAVGRVVLRCGDTRMQFEKDGSVETRAHQITSAAVETHRIEGGSIELN